MVLFFFYFAIRAYTIYVRTTILLLSPDDKYLLFLRFNKTNIRTGQCEKNVNQECHEEYWCHNLEHIKSMIRNRIKTMQHFQMTYILLKNLIFSLIISASYGFCPKQNFVLHILKEPLPLLKTLKRDGFSRNSYPSHSNLLSSMPGIDNTNVRKTSSDALENNENSLLMNWEDIANIFPARPIASGQKQLPLLERVAKVRTKV